MSARGTSLPGGLVVPSSGFFWGDDRTYDGNFTATETLIGRRMAIHRRHYGTGWTNSVTSTSNWPWPTTDETADAALRGPRCMPMITAAATMTGTTGFPVCTAGGNNGTFSNTSVINGHQGLDRVTAGEFDGMFTRAFQKIAAIPGPVWLILWQEMNIPAMGGYYQFQMKTGETKAQGKARYVAAWQHVANLAHATASNIIMVWAPTAFIPSGDTAQDALDTYPGDSFVDVVGCDRYRHTIDVSAFVYNFAVAHSKPFIIAETAVNPDSTNSGTSGPTIIANDLSTAKSTFSEMIAYVNWENGQTSGATADEMSAGANAAAYTSMLSDPYTQQYYTGSGGGGGGTSIDDLFARNVSNGWGTSNDSHPWTQLQGTASQLSVVSGSGGQVIQVAGNAPIIFTQDISQQDYDVTMTYKFSALPTAGTQNITACLRGTDAQDYTRFTIDQSVGGHAVLGLDRQVANVNTSLGTFDTGAAQTINTLYKARLQAIGKTVRARVWLASAAEPSTWQITGTDNAAPLITGAPGVRLQATAGWTGGAVYTITEFKAAIPSATSTPQIGIIYFENKGRATTLQQAAFATIDSTYASYTKYEGTSAPSLPDYVASTSGQYSGKGQFGGPASQGIDSATVAFASAQANIISQLATAGFSWKAYEEGSLTTSGWNGGGPTQAASRHSPAQFYNLSGSLGTNHGNGRYSFSVDYSLPLTCTINGGELQHDILNNSFPDFFLITPGNNSDGHDNWPTYADPFVANNINNIANSLRPGGMLAIVFDNIPAGADALGTGVIYCVIAGPGIVHKVDATGLNHFSLLKAIQTLFGVGHWTSGIDSHYTSAPTMTLPTSTGGTVLGSGSSLTTFTGHATGTVVPKGHSIRSQVGFVDSATAENSAALNAAINAAAADQTSTADTYIDQTGTSVPLTGVAQGLVTIPFVVGAANNNIYSFADSAVVPKSNVRIEVDSGVEIRQYATTPGTGPMFQCDQGATALTNFTICAGDQSRVAPAYQSGVTTGGRATVAERTGKWMMNLDAKVYGCNPGAKGVRFGGLNTFCRVGDLYAQSFCSETGGDPLDGTSGMIINAPNPTRGNANSIVVTDCIGETPPSYGITEWNAGDNCLFLRLGCYGGVTVRWETQSSSYSLTPVVPLSLSHNRAYDCWGRDSRRPLVMTNHSTRFTVNDNIAYRMTGYSPGMLANCGNTPNDGGTPTITNCEIHDSRMIAGHTALNTTGASTWLRGDSTDTYTTLFGAQPLIVNDCYDNSAGVVGFATHGWPACSSSVLTSKVFVCPDGAIHVFDPANNWVEIETHTGLSTIDGVRGVTASPDGKIIYFGHGSDGQVAGTGSLMAWDVVNKVVLYDVTYTHGVDQIAVTTDGTQIWMPDGEDHTTSVNWFVKNASTGAAIATVAATGATAPHNTMAAPKSGNMYLGPRHANQMQIWTQGRSLVKTLTSVGNPSGSSDGGMRPFTFDSSETLLFVTYTKFLGFGVIDIATDTRLFLVDMTSAQYGSFTYSTADPLTIPCHGISMSPDEKQLVLIDMNNSRAHFFDITGLMSNRTAPVRVSSPHINGATSDVQVAGNQSPCAYDCARYGWITHSWDGKHVYAQDVPDVLDAATLTTVGNIPVMANTRHGTIEIVYNGATPIYSPTHFGIGRKFFGQIPGSVPPVIGTAASTVTFTGRAAGAAFNHVRGSGVISIVGSATGKIIAEGVAGSSIVVTGLAAGHKVLHGSGSTSVVVTGTGVGVASNPGGAVTSPWRKVTNNGGRGNTVIPDPSRPGRAIAGGDVFGHHTTDTNGHIWVPRLRGIPVSTGSIPGKAYGRTACWSRKRLGTVYIGAGTLGSGTATFATKLDVTSPDPWTRTDLVGTRSFGTNVTNPMPDGNTRPASVMPRIGCGQLMDVYYTGSGSEYLFGACSNGIARWTDETTVANLMTGTWDGSVITTHVVGTQTLPLTWNPAWKALIVHIEGGLPVLYAAEYGLGGYNGGVNGTATGQSGRVYRITNILSGTPAVTTLGAAPSTVNDFSIDASGELYACSNDHIWHVTNAGATWTAIDDGKPLGRIVASFDFTTVAGVNTVIAVMGDTSASFQNWLTGRFVSGAWTWTWMPASAVKSVEYNNGNTYWLADRRENPNGALWQGSLARFDADGTSFYATGTGGMWKSDDLLTTVYPAGDGFGGSESSKMNTTGVGLFTAADVDWNGETTTNSWLTYTRMASGTPPGSNVLTVTVGGVVYTLNPTTPATFTRGGVNIDDGYFQGACIAPQGIAVDAAGTICVALNNGGVLRYQVNNQVSGTARMAITIAGQATGRATYRGTGRGTVAFTGAASGGQSRTGVAQGSVIFTGLATGRVRQHGLGVGVISVVGVGSATGTGLASPFWVKTNGSAVNGTSVATLTVPITAAPAIGDMLSVAVQTNGLQTITGVTDTAGNVYVVDLDTDHVSFDCVRFATTPLTGVPTSVTINLSAVSAQWVVQIDQWHGVTSGGTPLLLSSTLLPSPSLLPSGGRPDPAVTAQASGTNTTPTVISGVPRAISDLAIGLIGWHTGVTPGRTITASAPFTKRGEKDKTSGQYDSLAVFDSPLALSAVTMAGTLSGSVVGWHATVLGYKAGITFVTGTANGSIAVTGSASGTIGARGVGSGAFTITGSATGHIQIHAPAIGTIAVTGLAVGSKQTRAVASGSVIVTSVAAGRIGSHASGLLAVSFTGSAVGVAQRHVFLGVAGGSVSLTGLGTGRGTKKGSGALSVAYSGRGAGVAAHHVYQGVARGSIVVTGASRGRIVNHGVAAGSIQVQGIAFPTIDTTAIGAAAGGPIFTGFAAGAPINHIVGATAAGTVSVTGALTGRPIWEGAAAASISVIGTADGTILAHVVTGAASGTVSFTGRASAFGTSNGAGVGVVNILGIANGVKSIFGEVDMQAQGTLTVTGDVGGGNHLFAECDLTARGELTVGPVRRVNSAYVISTTDEPLEMWYHNLPHRKSIVLVNFVDLALARTEIMQDIANLFSSGKIHWYKTISATPIHVLFQGVATGVVEVEGLGIGKVTQHGQAAGTITIVGRSGSLVTKHVQIGTAASSLGVVGAASGISLTGVVSGLGKATTSITGLAAGHQVSYGSAIGAVAVAGEAFGFGAGRGTGVTSITGSAIGTVRSSGAGGGLVTVAGQAFGSTSHHTVSGLGSGNVTITGQLAGIATARARGTITVLGNIAGRPVSSGSGAASVIFVGVGNGVPISQSPFTSELGLLEPGMGEPGQS